MLEQNIERQLSRDLQRKQERKKAEPREGKLQKWSRTWVLSFNARFDFGSFVFATPRHPFLRNLLSKPGLVLGKSRCAR